MPPAISIPSSSRVASKSIAEIVEIAFECTVYVPLKKKPGHFEKVEGAGTFSCDIADTSWEEIQIMCFDCAMFEGKPLGDLLNKIAAKMDGDEECWGVYVTSTREFKKGKDERTLLPHGDLDKKQLETFGQFLCMAYAARGSKVSGISFKMSDPKVVLKKKRQVSRSFSCEWKWAQRRNCLLSMGCGLTV